jgi:hypothetical protein
MSTIARSPLVRERRWTSNPSPKKAFVRGFLTTGVPAIIAPASLPLKISDLFRTAGGLLPTTHGPMVRVHPQER